MLQRAAHNAYSWWWASHIRTKQSKWLEQNLVDVEQKVQSMMKIIDQDGDSFARRAEMYYKKRPELINFVEETYRAYRALAERYDLLSRDLQNANRTIATVFPEQIQMSMESDDDENHQLSYSSAASTASSSPEHHYSEKSFKNSLQATKSLNKTAASAKVPKPPTQPMKVQSAIASRREHLRKSVMSSSNSTSTSGLNKEEALKEIDAIQKEILALQTEKEFVKSSYERGLERFWEIEAKVTELQGKVFNLQEEFGIGTVIEDHEARNIMAMTALKSCAEALNRIHNEQEKSVEEMNTEYQRIKEAHDKLEDLKHLQRQQVGGKDGDELRPKSFEDIIGSNELQGLSTDAMKEKIKEQLMLDSSALTEPELAEKIDELVEKIVSLQTALCSQQSLVKRLRQYIDELLGHINTVMENKESMMAAAAQEVDNTKRILELEEELSKVKGLNQELIEQKNNLSDELTQANCNIDDLNEKLKNVKPEEAAEHTAEEAETDPEKEEEKHNENHSVIVCGEDGDNKQEDEEEEKHIESRLRDLREVEDEDGIINWRKLYKNNIEEREKILVEEYTIILRDYKDMKTKLSETEKQSRERIEELTSHEKEMKQAISMKEDEVKSLRRKLSLFQGDPDEIVDIKLEDTGTPRGQHERKKSQIEHDRQPLFHHLYDPKAAIISRTDNDDEEDEDVSSPMPHSKVEARLRAQLSELLEGNIDFWLRFSTSFHQIQRFQSAIKDLQSEVTRLREAKKNDKTHQLNLKSDARPLYKHLREIQTEMTLWLEHSHAFQQELRSRCAALDNIQQEITKLSNPTRKGNNDAESELSDYRAGKFQGEVINMKQENRKVAEELQAGVHRVTALQTEVENAMTKLDKEFKLSESSAALTTLTRPRIPLQSFLFGVKLKKKHKPKQPSASSLYTCTSPAPPPPSTAPTIHKHRHGSFHSMS